MSIGPYTHEQNHEDETFGIPLVKSDHIVIEYYQSANILEEPQLNINTVFHAYLDIHNFYGERDDRDCGDNVNCSSADNYQDPVNAAAFLDMGGYICSGSMINNTNNDLTPYFLTAWHCVNGENVNTFRFYFNYETSSCSGNNASYGSYAYSSDLLLSSGDMDPDFALLLIDDDIYTSWNVFYAGWNIDGSPSQAASVGVHHPGGEPKQINLSRTGSTPLRWFLMPWFK